ncbi:MAG: hypothetical protein WBF79_01335 [Rhodococcus sp. (in: high G+C Gram-positive bacteria)]
MTGDRLSAVLARLVGAQRVLMVEPDAVSSVVHAAGAIGPHGSVVVLAGAGTAPALQDGVETAGVGDRVQIIEGEPVGSLPHLRTDDDTTFEVVVVGVTHASPADAVQYLEWALVLGRCGTALVVTSTGVAEAWSAADELLRMHPRIEATSWSNGDALVAVAVIGD